MVVLPSWGYQGDLMHPLWQVVLATLLLENDPLRARLRDRGGEPPSTWVTHDGAAL